VVRLDLSPNQSKAGYIDARPHHQLVEIVLLRTAGPYIWVILDAGQPGLQAFPCPQLLPKSNHKFNAFAAGAMGRTVRTDYPSRWLIYRFPAA
jgi:hypothetical protein